ncbi:MAG: DUF2948 family protein [Maricaulaceae bacterium]
MTRSLKLKAQTAEDLTVISSLIQDAILRVGEISFDKTAHALSLRLYRFSNEDKKKSERILTGLRFDGVLSVASRGIDRSDKEAMAVLLSLDFTPAEEQPAGQLSLIFAGGGEIVCELECIDAILADVSASRATQSAPLHPLAD